MKKYLVSVLILSTLLVVFGPIYFAEAQTGTCYKDAGAVVGTGVTKTNCIDILKGETWEEDKKVENNQNKLSGQENYNSCIRNGGSVEDCKNYASVSTPTDTSYHLLEQTLPCTEGTPGCENGKLVSFDVGGAAKLGVYLNLIITLIIGLCAVGAVVMIVIAGVEYSTSGLISSKEAAKERIRNALLGLVLALGSYTILYTINPDLLITDLEVDTVSLGVVTEEYAFTVEELVKLVKEGSLNIAQGKAIPGTQCDPNKLSETARNDGINITTQEINTLACITIPESSCNTSGRQTNYAWNGAIVNGKYARSTAVGPFQALLSLHSAIYMKSPACIKANGGKPLNCKNVGPGTSNEAACIKMGNNLGCSLSVALELKRANKGYRDWTADKCGSRGQLECVAKNDPSSFAKSVKATAKCREVAKNLVDEGWGQKYGVTFP